MGDRMSATTMDDIAEEIKKMKFRKNIIGGLNEEDVWKKLGQPQEDYRRVLDISNKQYEALIEGKRQKQLKRCARKLSILKRKAARQFGKKDSS